MNATDAVCLMIDNHRESLEHAQELARTAAERGKQDPSFAEGIWNAEQAELYTLAEDLKDYIEEQIDDMPLATFRDALRSELASRAFDSVDWHEVARSYLESIRENA